MSTLLTQRVFGIAMGYEDGNDHQTLRHDPILQMLAGFAPNPEEPLASSPTLCRFENWVDRKSLARMSAVFVDQFITSYRRPPKEIVLDFDATDDVVGLATNERLKRSAEPFMDAAEQQFEATGEKQRDFHEFAHGAETWGRKRRVILKAEHLSKGANARFVVTNLGDAPDEIYDTLYTQRGEMENRIPDQQLYLFADQMSCHKFVANQLRLLLSLAAYMLIEHVRREGLKDTDLAAARVDTIRLKLLKVAARVVVSVRRVVLHLCSSYPYRSLLTRLVERLVPS